MLAVGLGTDIIEIDRIRRAVEKFGQRFLDRIFTKQEIDYCLNKRDPFPSLAVRFAAKEAVSKALHTGINGKLAWTDIEVVTNVNGAPNIVLHQGGAPQYNTKEILVSLSHSRDYAIASALIIE